MSMHKECKIGIKYGKFTFVYERRVAKQDPVKEIAPVEVKALTYTGLKKGGRINVYA